MPTADHRRGPAGHPTAMAGWGVGAILLAAQLLPVGAVTPAAQDPDEGDGPTAPSCVTSECHTGYADRAFAHGPAALGRCLDCHGYEEDDSTPYEAGEDHWFYEHEEDGRLCLQCHESFEDEGFVHYPLRRFKCLTCHDPHGSEQPGMMRHEKPVDTCFECHERKKDDDPFVHAPIRVGACTVCHDPHGSPNDMGLVVSGSALCLRCHVDMKERLEGARFAHRPVVEDCANCHDPHDSTFKYQLEDAVPGLCLGCHEDMTEHLETVQYGHGALDQERSCLQCHDPHLSQLARQLRDVPINLCLGCHNESLVGKDRVLRDMEAFLAENPDHHGPIRTGDCAACHNPHGADFAPLLRRFFPVTFYAPFDPVNYSLCFGCHEQSIVMEQETETVTNFRNGTKNLHFVHVHRETKGRTCRACHDVHASKFPKHLAETVPFGQWDLPISYVGTPEGGRCSPGCHEPRGYDRVNPVFNPFVNQNQDTSTRDASDTPQSHEGQRR